VILLLLFVSRKKIILQKDFYKKIILQKGFYKKIILQERIFVYEY